MKNKFLIAAFLVAASLFSFGDLLFWEVDSAAVSKAQIGEWSYASLYYVDGNTSKKLENLVGGYDGTASMLSADIFSSALVAAQLGDAASSWSFYVELYNSWGLPSSAFMATLPIMAPAFISSPLFTCTLSTLQYTEMYLPWRTSTQV